MAEVKVYVRLGSTEDTRRVSFRRPDLPVADALAAGYAIDGIQLICEVPLTDLLAKEREVMAFLEAHGHTVADFL